MSQESLRQQQRTAFRARKGGYSGAVPRKGNADGQLASELMEQAIVMLKGRKWAERDTRKKRRRGVSGQEL